MVPINIRLAEPEVEFWMADAGAGILFVDATFAPMVASIKGRLERLEHVVFMGEDPAPVGMVAQEELVSGNAPMHPAPRGNGDLSGLFYTGGTTGRSKGVMLSPDNW
jgi:long-chain acyl-CoA synthetase